MRWFEDLNLGQHPFRFFFRSYSTANFGGYFHAHQGIELLYIHQGQGVLIVDRKLHPVESGTLICLQPYQLHRIEMDISPESPYERTILSFEPLALESLLNHLPLMHKFLTFLHQEEMPAFVIANMSTNVHFTSLLDHYQHRLETIPLEEREEESQLFVVSLLQCLRTHWAKEGLTQLEHTGQRPIHHVEQIMQYLESRYMEPFQLEVLANELHLSKYHVSRLFRQATGNTITEYLLYRRIREACLLLATTKLSMREIGSAIGIDHFSHFCLVFKKILGTTPLQYRKQTNQSFVFTDRVQG